MRLILETREKAQKFAEIFKNLKNVVDEINMTFTPNNIYMQGMDNTHALLFEMILEKDWFDTYEATEEDTFGMHCATFFQIINCFKENQTIEIKLEPIDDYLTIIFAGENQIHKAFEMARIEIDSQLLDIPEVEYEVDICFNSNEFSELIKETAIFNDTINIKFTEENIKMIASGTLGKLTATINEDDIIMFSIEEGCNLNLNYTLGFLNKICGFSRLNNEIQVHCSQETPMKIQYNLDKTEADSEDIAKSYCRFFIAPKIEDN